MRGLAAIAGVLTSAAFCAGAAAEEPGKSVIASIGPLTVSSLKAVFVPTKLGTEYSVTATDTALKPGQKLAYVWVLTLQLVDPAGSAPPGNPGSGAAVDPSCDDIILPGGITEELALGSGIILGRVWQKLGDTFTWFHGDRGSYPGSDYGCDHTKMGPSGHQGIVDLAVVTPDGQWECDLQMRGSNLTPVPVYSDAPRCENKLRTRIESDLRSVESDIAYEKEALGEIGSNDAEAKKFLDTLASGLAAETGDLKTSGLTKEGVAELNDAAELDARAATDDVGTAEGRVDASDAVESAIKQKLRALPLIQKLLDAIPAR